MTKNIISLKLHCKKFCHTKRVCGTAVLNIYLNSAWKNTSGTQITFHVTKIVFTGYISVSLTTLDNNGTSPVLPG